MSPLHRITTSTAGSPFRCGYGWMIRNVPGKRLFFHVGYYRSFGTECRRYVDRDLAICRGNGRLSGVSEFTRSAGQPGG